MIGENMNRKVLAIDFGASSGRAVLGELKDGKLSLTEIHRFSNDPVFVSHKKGKTMHWDYLRLFHEIKQSLVKSKQYGKIDSIAIDTWGVDFGLIDNEGRIIEAPVHYRDERTSGMVDKSKEYIPTDKLYNITGIQVMEINTAFQLLSLKENRPELLERADKMLLTPDLFSYLLGADMVSEISIASTTQLFDAKTKDWSDSVINDLGLKREMFPRVVDSGTVTGILSPDICDELDIDPCKIIAVCGHDTQSAMVAVPTDEKDFAFLSCGTWSLLGTELDCPVINEDSTRLNLSNETAFGRKTALLKNIIGLWLIQESRRQWIREGNEYSYAELEKAARKSKPMQCFIDPDHPDFSPAGNMPQRIKDYCKRTGQYVPQTVGEVMRCIYESLALKYREATEQLSQCTGKEFSTLYMVGGGTKDRFLAELTACSIGKRVSCGPVEATAIGNISVQLMALGDIDNIPEARQIVTQSEEVYLYEPSDRELWDNAYEKFKMIVKEG